MSDLRNILAALLRDRGYRNTDDDRYWYHDSLGVRPLMVCVEWELRREEARV